MLSAARAMVQTERLLNCNIAAALARYQWKVRWKFLSKTWYLSSARACQHIAQSCQQLPETHFIQGAGFRQEPAIPSGFASLAALPHSLHSDYRLLSCENACTPLPARIHAFKQGRRRPSEQSVERAQPPPTQSKERSSFLFHSASSKFSCGMKFGKISALTPLFGVPRSV